MSLKANQTDSIATAGGISAADTSFTLTTGAFDTKSSGDKVPLTIDYDNYAKLEVVTGYINGTAVSSLVRAKDGTSATTHALGAKVCIGSVPSAWEYFIKNDLTAGAIPTTALTSVATVGASVYLNGAQDNLTDTTWTKVLLDTETYDLGSNFASYKFVAPVTGYYLVTAHVTFANAIDDKQYYGAIYVNNASVLTDVQAMGTTGGATSPGVNLSKIVKLTATDYVELFARVNCGANTVDLTTGVSATYMAIQFLHL